MATTHKIKTIEDLIEEINVYHEFLSEWCFP